MNKRILILVLTNNQEPWKTIFDEGALPTWISDTRKDTRVLAYTGKKPNWIQSKRESLTGRMRHNRFVHLQRNIDRVFKGIFTLRTEDGSISNHYIAQNYPELHSTIGVRTLAAFSTALNDPDWDYLWRANVSNYVNIEALYDYLNRIPSSNFAGGVVNHYKGDSYLSGAGYLLSRDVVEKVVYDAKFWDHTLLDDVSLGKMLQRMDINLVQIPRISFTLHSQVEKFDPNLIRITPSFRCNGGLDRKEDVLIMHELHKLLCGTKHEPEH